MVVQAVRFIEEPAHPDSGGGLTCKVCDGAERAYEEASRSQEMSESPRKGLAIQIDKNKNEMPSAEDLQLLAKLEEANRQIETDSKSLNSLSNNSGHSRRSSDTSQVSVQSGGSSGACSPNAEQENGEEDNWTLWGQIVNDWETFSKKRTPQLKELVRKGVPTHFRGIVWQLLCGAHNSSLKNKYVQYIKSHSPCEKVIRRDIARTYPEHEFFKEKDGFGQESLFNVMKAYSLHDREVGYCQGSAFIVGLLLMQQMPEEDAFATFVKLMQDYRLREMFKPSMSELGLCMFQLECMVQELIPELHIHFQSQSFHTSMYASSWFLTLFTTALPLPVACRIVDVFLLEGIEAVFRVAVAILLASRDKLLQLDMEGMLKYFQREVPGQFGSEPDALMHMAYNVKYNSKKMKKLEKDYTVMKTKEQEDLIELRRLRTENRLLRQRIEQLEKESADLADRLIQGQVSRAEEQEWNFEIKRELAAIKARDSETQQKLEEAKDRIRKLSQMMEEPPSMDSSQEVSLKSEIIQQKEELIQCLQSELVTVRLREAENEATIRDLRARIQELEEDKKQLREWTPEHSVAKLEEQLIAFKLQEGELKHQNQVLRQKLSDLRAEFERHIKLQQEKEEKPKASSEHSTPAKKIGALFRENNRPDPRLEEELLSLKLKEAEASADVMSLRQRVMELEAQTQVSGNQVRRAEEDLTKCQTQLEEYAAKEKSLTALVKEHERKYSDLESKMKEELMLARIRDAEKSQCVAELTHKISSLEVKNQELVVEGELTRSDDSEDVRHLQDKIAELKAEILRLQLQNRKLSLSVSLQNLHLARSMSASEDDSEDLRLKPEESCNGSSESGGE